MNVKRRRGDRGAAAVEFALVLPVLLLVIFGIVDFGRMLYIKITLTQAAESSARATAILGQQQGVQEAKTAIGDLDPNQLDPPDVHACPSPPDPTQNATVTLTYHFQFVTPLAALAHLGDANGTIDLTSTGYSPCVN
jgi:Flp pilus assembly protein TadG